MSTSSAKTSGVALVTGASSGIGRVFAHRLAGDGYHVVLVARRRERLEASLREIEAAGGSGEVLAADLADREGLVAVERRAAAGDVTLLVNNAGFQTYQPFTELSIDRAEAEVAVQVTAVMRLCHAVLPAMIARGDGAIINISSMLSFSGSLDAPYMPKRSMYASTKAFVTAFSTLLAAELADTGVRVQAFCPGVVRTEFHDVDGEPVLRPKVPIMEPEDAVKAALRGLELGDTICIPSLEDREKLSAVAEAQGALFGAGRGSELASRYR
jgi:hypothetical protein